MYIVGEQLGIGRQGGQPGFADLGSGQTRALKMQVDASKILQNTCARLRLIMNTTLESGTIACAGSGPPKRPLKEVWGKDALPPSEMDR